MSRLLKSKLAIHLRYRFSTLCNISGKVKTTIMLDEVTCGTCKFYIHQLGFDID